jgi:hypothetical protein
MARVIASMANFVASEAPDPGSALRRAMDPTFTMRPREWRYSGRHACVTATKPRTFTSN